MLDGPADIDIGIDSSVTADSTSLCSHHHFCFTQFWKLFAGGCRSARSNTAELQNAGRFFGHPRGACYRSPNAASLDLIKNRAMQLDRALRLELRFPVRSSLMLD